MYSVSVSEVFIAQHYLTVPDPGPEGTVHSHEYTVESTFSGPEINEYGYLVDIDRVLEAVATVVDTFRDRTLNDLPPFDGLNPSVEHLTRVFGDRLLEQVRPAGASELEVRIREDDVATVRHHRTLETN